MRALWEQKSVTIALSSYISLFDLLLQASKKLRTKELLNCDTQAIAKLLDGRHSSAVIAPTNNIVYRGLCHTADAAEFVDGNIALLAELKNPLPDGFTNCHGYHLFLNKIIPVCT